MRTLVTVAILVVAVIAALTFWLLASESRLLFYPARESAGTPSDWGWRFEDVALVAVDGVKLHGWWVPHAPERSDAGVTVLFLHGNAGNISHRREKLALYRDLGADVLIVDYRGYGRSGGQPGEDGFRRDAYAAYEHLTNVRGVAPRRVLVHGESIGAAVAARLAAEVPIGAVVLEAAFTSVPDVAAAMYPVLPVRWLVRNRFETLARIPNIRAPIFVLHSRGDEYFPIQHAERLAAAGGSRARLIELQGGHNDAFLVSAPIYRRALEEAIAAVARPE